MSAHRSAALLPALIAAAICIPAVRGGFVIDDSYLVVDNQALRSLGNVPGFFTAAWGGGAGGASHAAVNAAYYRPLTMALHALEYAVFGLHPAGWHLVSLLLHAAAAGLVAVLAMRLLRRRTGALAAGALFAVHPVHTEAVAAVSYQTTLLAAVLALAALAVFGRMLEEGVTRGRTAAIVLLTLAAVAAKEEAIVLPLMAGAWWYLAKPVGGDGRRPALLAGIAPMALAVGAFTVVRSAFVTSSGVDFFEGAPALTVLLTMLRVAGLYTGLLLAPFDLCPFYDWFIVPPQTGLSWGVVAGLLSITGLTAGVVACVRRAPGVAVGLLWVPLGLVPVLHLVPILNVAAERFLYLGSAGFCVAAGGALALVLERTRGTRLRYPGRAVAAAIVLLLGARTLVRWPEWRDDDALDRATAIRFPETPVPLVNLADRAARAGRTGEARALLEQARQRAPGWPVAERLLGELQRSGGQVLTTPTPP